MRLLRSVALLGVSALLLGSFGACKGASSSSEPVVAQGAGGKTPIDLELGQSGTEVGGAAGAADDAAPRVPSCESFAGLDGCGVTSVEATFSAANVLLVIDKSSSMDDQPAGFETKKWEALKAALEPALMAVKDEMSFGLLLYPFGEKDEIPLDCFEGCCEVPKGDAAVQVHVEPGARSAQQVLDTLSATAPGGGTPTAAALDAALTYFTVGDGRKLQGDRFVLLATDGGPNCGERDATCGADRCTPNLDGLCPASQGNCCEGEGAYCLDDEAVIRKIRALADAGVPTFVVGIPGTESYADYLSAFATAGGVASPNPPAYYAVSAEGGVSGLTQTFIDITTHLVRSCQVDLGRGAPVKKLINVAVDCTIVPFEDGAGWDLSGDTAATTLVLGGDTCQRVEREGARRIDVVYGCPTVK